MYQRCVSCTGGACRVRAARVVHRRSVSCTDGACSVPAARDVYSRRDIGVCSGETKSLNYLWFQEQMCSIRQ